MRIKNLRGVSEVQFKKTRLLHLGNVEKPPHPQLSAQRISFYNEIRLSSAGDRLLIIRIDETNYDEYFDECSKVHVWQLNDRNRPNHWVEFEKDSNLCKSYPFYAMNFPPVIGRI